MAQITQIQVRRDTAANWTSVNPTLTAGEIGFETDTGKFKIGNGSSTWTSLTYATDGSKLTGTINAATATTATTATSATTATTATTAVNVSGTVAVANGGTGKTTFGGSAGVLKTDGADFLTAAQILNSDVSVSAAIDPTKISGTATTLTQLRNRFYQSTTAIDLPSRASSMSTVTNVHLKNTGWYFTPDTTLTVSKIQTVISTAANWTGATNTITNSGGSSGTSGSTTVTLTTAVGTPVPNNQISGTGIASGARITAVSANGLTLTLDTPNTGTVSGTITITQGSQAKAGIYTLSGSSGSTVMTPVAVSAWVNSPFTATGLNDFNLTSSYTLNAGTTYGVGYVTTWAGTATTAPVNVCQFLGSNSSTFAATASLAPQVGYQFTVTPDIVTLTSTGSGIALPYLRLS